MEENLLLTFDSVAFAMKGESFLEEKEIPFKTIPTPRVISSSCGLSIMTDLDQVEYLKREAEEGNFSARKFYKFTREDQEEAVEL